MITIRYVASFIRDYKNLDSNLKEEVRDAVLFFKEAKNHTKLKVHKLKGNMENTFSFSVNYKIRIIFEYENKKTVNLLRVGLHDEVY